MLDRQQMQVLKTFLQEILSSYESACCLTGDGELLDLKYENLGDIGTLSAAAQTVIKYFPLGIGDAVLLNDPYSGGTTLSYMTLVTPIVKGDPNLYLALRTGFRPRLLISNALDEEGLRIPPTPLVQNRAINAAIMDAIAAHPLCPEGLHERVESLLNRLWNQIDWLQKVYADKKIINKSLTKFYLKESRDWLSHYLSELPHAETKVDKKLSTGEHLRLKLELSPEKIHFDFAGTSTSKRICLTDSATFGACFGAVAAFLQKEIPINSGTFSLLEVSSPLGCLLNSKYPSPTFKGMTEGTTLVASLVLEALAEIYPAKSISGSAQTPTQMGLEFSDGKRFFDSLPGGIGASANSNGCDAIQFWTRNRLQNSVQEIEIRFPLRIHKVCLRANSGGKGQRNGGHGMTKEYELLESAQFYWMTEGKKQAPQGQKGGQAGAAAEILIKKGEQVQSLDKEEGSLFLEAGTILSISSAGGGGYGKNQ